MFELESASVHNRGGVLCTPSDFRAPGSSFNGSWGHRALSGLIGGYWRGSGYGWESSGNNMREQSSDRRRGMASSRRWLRADKRLRPRGSYRKAPK